MRVDACTAEVKACLTSDDACGADYSKCIGLDTYAIGNLCPADKLTACMAENRFGADAENEIRTYVASVAQGIALNIDNNMLTTCQNALKTAMVSVCGAEDSCPNATINTSFFNDMMSMKICKEGDPDSQCHEDAYTFTKDDLIKGLLSARIVNKPDLSLIDYNTTQQTQAGVTRLMASFVSDPDEVKKHLDELKKLFDDADTTSVADTLNSNLSKINAALNSALQSKISEIESDPKITYCMSGREVQGFDGNSFGKGKGDNATTLKRFPNLTDNAKTIIAGELMSKLWSAYDATVEKITDNEFKKYTQKINDALASYIEMKQEEQKKYNMLSCQKQEERHRSPNIHGCKRTYADKLATYDANTNICTVTVIDYDRGGCGMAYKWREEKRTTKTIPMPTVSRGKLVFGSIDSNGGIEGLSIEAKQSKDANGNQL